MAERGAAALSLREVARQMGMSSAAIYRYFANRDELVTALIVDAYADLAAALDAAAASAPVDHFLDLALAYRAWALDHPSDYALILGTPIPGYHAPEAITRPAAHRSMARFIEVALAARGRGAESTAGIRPAETPARGLADLPPAVRDLALAGWGQMHGLVSLELFGHLDALGEDPGTLYRYEMAAFAARIGSSGAPDDAAPTSPVARAE
jgi:AcrR family transcriptional regulator